MPYLLAILERLSPLFTLYVEVEDDDTLDELELLELVEPFSFRTCPMRSKSDFKPFSFFSSLTVMPYLFEIFQRLSPLFTLYVEEDEELLAFELVDLPLIDKVCPA